jgi:hypothetical protein
VTRLARVGCRVRIQQSVGTSDGLGPAIVLNHNIALLLLLSSLSTAERGKAKDR